MTVDDPGMNDRPREIVTLVRPDAPTRRGRRAPSSFPSDLFEQARGRLRLLATFFFVAFSFDLIIFATLVAIQNQIPREAVRTAAVQWVNLGAALMSVCGGRQGAPAFQPRASTGSAWAMRLCFVPSSAS